MHWILDENINKKSVEVLSAQLKVPSIIASILIKRNINTFEKAKKFFRPNEKDFYRPLLMKGMKLATNRIIEAIDNNDKILIYGDYDVDGTCSVALMMLFFKRLNADVVFYQPDRYKEGYGISMQGVELARDKNINLIIALDCGVKAIEQAKKISSYNIDLIICDHHLPGKTLPISYAMLNPKQEGCNYPFKELCGCGIGFKLIQNIIKTKNISSFNASEYLDIVAVATAADIVPLVDENRLITSLGIKLLNESPRKCFKQMLDFAKRNKKIEISDIVFGIAPRINAAGRLKHASLATKLIISTNNISNNCQEIENLNLERKEIDKRITNEALSSLQEEKKKKYTTVVYDENWHKGVVGIVASRLIETYYRPTIVLCKDGDVISGSVRSVSGFDIYEVLYEIKDLFIKFGGHKYAAGLSLYENKLDELKSRFEDGVRKRIKEEQTKPNLIIDGVINPKDLNLDVKNNPYPKLLRLVDQFAPFGPSNMRPVFVMDKLTNAGYSKIVGENHLKFHIKTKNDDKNTFFGIGFNMGGAYSILKDKKEFSLAFTLNKNEYDGFKSLQLNVKDIKAAKLKHI